MKGTGPLHGVGVRGLVSRVLAFSPMGLHGEGKGIYSPDRPSWTSKPPGLRGGGRFFTVQGGLPRGNRTLGTEDPTGFRGTARVVRASRHFIVLDAPPLSPVDVPRGFPTGFCMTRVMRLPTAKRGLVGRERQTG